MDADTVILRALNSHETFVTGTLTPLDRLGNSLATVFDCTYYPAMLHKTKLTPSIKSLTLPEREAALKDVYRIDPELFDLNHRKVLIIDDVTTTGATACAIIKSILEHFPEAGMNIFSLAWTPSPKQQSYILDQMGKSMTMNEPVLQYGKTTATWVDQDYNRGQTNISLFL